MTTHIHIAGDEGEDEIRPQWSSESSNATNMKISSGASLTYDVAKLVFRSRPFRITHHKSGIQTERILQVKRFGAHNSIVRACAYEKMDTAPGPSKKPETEEHNNKGSQKKRILILHHDSNPESAITDGSGAIDAYNRKIIKLIDEVVGVASRDEVGKKKDNAPNIFVKLLSIPEWKTQYANNNHQYEFESSIWKKLQQVKHKVCIITCASTLRHNDCIISRRLSYERMVEDICSELHRHPGLRLLATFGHVFVRIGMIAIVHIRQNNNVDSLSRFEGEIYFDSSPNQGVHRDEVEEGFTIGRNSVLLFQILEHVLSSSGNEDISKSAMQKACENTIRATRAMDDAGYPDAKDLVASIKESLVKACSPCTLSERTISCARIPERILNIPHQQDPRTNTPWHILDNVLRESPVHRINIAMAIVHGGHQKVLNRKWSHGEKYARRDREIFKILSRYEYWNPADRTPDYVTLQEDYDPAMPAAFDDARFSRKHRAPIKIYYSNLDPFWLDVPLFNMGGKDSELTLVERDEIESFRRAKNLLGLYCNKLKKESKPRPISIAIFGAPGTGKSYVVSKIAASLSTDERELRMFTINMGQVDSSSAFVDAIVSASRSWTNWKSDSDGRGGHTLKVPIIFFDEFDSSVNGNELAWLRYYLAIMQDGSIGDISLNGCILCFAGGTKTTFEQFDPRTDSSNDNLRSSPEYQQKLNRFIVQKGPDFISRLRGHIDILPVNNEPGRPKHFVRRAMALRSIIERHNHIDRDGISTVSTAVVYAMLTTDMFLHGIRSMEAIVEMCAPIHNKIEIASLPPEAQLDMHVDAKEFMIRVHRGRERTWSEWQYQPRPIEGGRPATPG